MLRQASEGVAFAKRGVRIWLGEFERPRGRLLFAQGADDVAIEAAFSRSLAVARDQRSAWIELRTATDFARWRLQSGTVPQRQACRRALSRALARGLIVVSAHRGQAAAEVGEGSGVLHLPRHNLNTRSPSLKLRGVSRMTACRIPGAGER